MNTGKIKQGINMVAQGGVTITVDDEQVKRLLTEIADRASDLKPALTKVGELMKESIRTNFRDGGRPLPWKPIKNRDGQPLLDTKRLMNSVTRKVKDNEVRIGTNAVYAALHNFGAERGSFGTVTATVEPHIRLMNQVFGKRLAKAKRISVGSYQRKMRLPRGDIPARPFMLVQDEDLAEIKDILTNYITGSDV